MHPSTTTGNNDHDHGRRHHHHHHHFENIHHLLGALSFEHSPIPFLRRNHVAVDNNNNNNNNNNKEAGLQIPLPFTKPLARPPEMPAEVAHRSSLFRISRNHNNNKSSKSPSTTAIRHANVILYGTLDPEGHVEGVFYDAHEFGDSEEDPNEFDETAFRRDSVLVPSIIATRGGDAVNNTSLSGQPENESSLVREGHLLHQVVTNNNNNINDPPQKHPYWSSLPPPPPPPHELPLRFLRAGKGDPTEGLRRYCATLSWRREQHMDTILRQPVPHYQLFKQHYPSYFHLRSRHNECCYYEQPPRTNLQALRDAGITLDDLLHYYAMVTEFQWQMLERDDLACGITIIDLQGIKLGDFVGEVKDFVLRASEFCGQHYPERAACVFVINVPAWFKLIFNVIKPFIDAATLEKIKILRGPEEMQRVMQERIPLENLPPEYGGSSMPLGQSPEEELFAALCEHNNALAAARGEEEEYSSSSCCNGPNGNPPCQFCSWRPARSY